VKRCPTCKKTFSDQNLSFCIDDGTPLVTSETPAEDTPADELTQVSSSSRSDESSSGRSSSSSAVGEGAAPAYQPPGSYVPPGYAGQSKRRTWPWVLGFLALVFLVIAGFGIAAVKLFPRMLPASTNSNTANLNPNVDRRNNTNANLNERNSNSNSTNRNENSNDNSDADDNTPPPTNQEEVLADLKNLENDWTVANINADKRQLNHILADDYVGTIEGRSQGKAEYLKTVKRDTAIQHWEFADLKLKLNADRASITGSLRLAIKDDHGQDQELTFRFTDKFVWRDGRWQATASEVAATTVKELTSSEPFVIVTKDQTFGSRIKCQSLAT
jgi:ketosteroid isomerase-like protein